MANLTRTLVLVSGALGLAFVAAACSDDTTADGAGGGGASSGGYPAATDGGSHSGGAAVTGGNGGGGLGGASAECTEYCDLWTAKDCNAHSTQDYATDEACLTTCATFTPGGSGTTGNTVQCRINHLNLIPGQSADIHCDHTAAVPSAGGCLD